MIYYLTIYLLLCPSPSSGGHVDQTKVFPKGDCYIIRRESKLFSNIGSNKSYFNPFSSPLLPGCRRRVYVPGENGRYQQYTLRNDRHWVDSDCENQCFYKLEGWLKLSD